MGKTGWIEKRQHERIVATLKVDYRLVDPGDSRKILEHDHYKQTTVDRLPVLAGRSPLYHAVTRDISLGGLALVGQEPFTPGTTVEIGLHLPQYKSVLKFLAKIVHAESFTEMGRAVHRAGVQTLAINRSDMDRIERFILSRHLSK